MRKLLRLRQLGLGLLALLAVLFAGCDTNAPPQVQSLEVNTLNYSALVYWQTSDPDNDALTCAVDFGDGVRSWVGSCDQVRHAFHVYANAGSYLLTLEVRDSAGNLTEKTYPVAVPQTPSDACPSAAPSSLALQGLPEKPAPTGVAFAPEAVTEPGKLLIRTRTADLDTLSSRLAPLKLTAQQTPLLGWAVVKVPRGEEKALAERLVAEGIAEYAQPVYRYRPVGTPDDPYFSYQSAQYEQLRLTEGWDLLDPGACRPIAAVVDSGADYNHEDLGVHLLPGYDFSDDDPDASFDPASASKEHGTMVAGVIGAVTNNTIGVAGSTNNLAYVLPLKVFDNGTSETIAEAIYYAADAGAHLINLSLCILGSDGHCADLTDNPDQFIEDALAYASGRGAIALAASGNYGDAFVGYPASSDYTIAVGSVDSSNARSDFSNYGTKLDFAAPGESVPTTAPQDQYLFGTGTSFATPYVTGVLALYLGQYYAEKGTLPSFSQAYTCLQNNTNQTAWNEETGWGVPQTDQVLDPADGTCYP